MDETSFAAIKDSLQKELMTLTATAQQCRDALDVAEQRRRRIEAALAALDGTDLKEVPRGKPPKDKAKTSLPSAGKAEVARYVQSLLEEAGELEVKDLKARVEELAQKNGFTRLGLALRIKEVLSDPKLVDTPFGVRIAKAQLAS